MRSTVARQKKKKYQNNNNKKRVTKKVTRSAGESPGWRTCSKLSGEYPFNDINIRETHASVFGFMYVYNIYNIKHHCAHRLGYSRIHGNTVYGMMWKIIQSRFYRSPSYYAHRDIKLLIIIDCASCIYIILLYYYHRLPYHLRPTVYKWTTLCSSNIIT